jgi:phage major head subunit gpT-like protein
MSQIVPANLAAAFLEFNLRFNQAMTFAPIWWDKLAYEQPSVGESVTYSLLDKIAAPAQVAGRPAAGDPERVAPQLLAGQRRLRADRGDRPQQVRRRPLRQLRPALHPDGRAGRAVAGRHARDGAAGRRGRGVALLRRPAVLLDVAPQNIDAPATTYSNLNASGLALTAANYNTQRAAMMSYNGADGKPLGIIPNLLIVPPQLEQAGKQILNTDWIAPGAAFGAIAANAPSQNTLRGSADLLMVPQLANEPTVWYLAMVTSSIKPLVFQKRKAPVFQMFTNPTDPEVWKNRKYVFGTDARGAVGYTAPFLISRNAA